MFWDGVEWNYPCVSVPLLLQPTNCPKWTVPYTTETKFCGNVSYPSLCNVINLFLDCQCAYLGYEIKIYEVCGNSDIPCGTIYTKEVNEQRDIDDATQSEALFSVLITQDIINEMGISLSSGKVYRITLGIFQTGIFEQKFRIPPQDISLAYLNLIDPYDFFNNLPWPPFGNFPVSDLLGRYVTLDHITTTNDYGTNNINIRATKSISITNSVITPGFSVGIVDNACEGFSGRMANPDGGDENTKPGKYYNERVVYYNSNPVRSDTTFVSKNKEDENLSLKTSTEPVYLLIPNPSSSGRFAFSSQIPESGNCELVIFNLLGEKIFQSRIPNSQSAIDISNQPKGTYFVQISNGAEMRVQKIVYQ